MDILQLIKARRTIRKYKNQPIPVEVLNKIIESGTYAPSAHNCQPWSFTIIEKDNAGKDFIAKLRKYPEHQFLPSINFTIKNTIEIMDNAPVVILVYNNCKFSQHSRKLGPQYGKAAYISEIESISAAIQNMHLTATYLGIGMAWLTTPLLIKDCFKQVPNSNYELIAVLSLGYPAEEEINPVRKKNTEIAKLV